jgi:hypothetical protein
VVALVVWLATSRLMAKAMSKGPAASYWVPMQWLSTAALWSVWIQQDAANIAVYLPRSLSVAELAGFAGFITLGLGVLMYLRGDRIQEIVNEKSHVVDVRPATIIDFVYAGLLYYFKVLSTIPMSTTWVFLGLLAGRELAISLRGDSGRSVASSFRLAGRDVLYAAIGLAVSIALAFATNPNLIDFDGDGAEARALEEASIAREAHRDSIDAGLLILNPDGSVTVAPATELPVAPADTTAARP